jgi:hypothetical protein
VNFKRNIDDLSFSLIRELIVTQRRKDAKLRKDREWEDVRAKVRHASSKPFAQPLFCVVLWNFAFGGRFQSVPHFFKDVEMILNIFK